MSNRRKKKENLGFDQNIARHREAWIAWKKHCEEMLAEAATFNEERAFNALFRLKEAASKQFQEAAQNYRDASAYDVWLHNECLYAVLRVESLIRCFEAQVQFCLTWQQTLIQAVETFLTLGSERHSRIAALVDCLSGDSDEEKARLLGVASASWRLRDTDKMALRLAEDDGEDLSEGQSASKQQVAKHKLLLLSLAPLYETEHSIPVDGQEIVLKDFPVLRWDMEADQDWKRLGPNASLALRKEFTAAKAAQREIPASSLSGADALALDQATDGNDPERALFAREAFDDAMALLKEAKLSEREIDCYGWKAMGYKDAEIAAQLGIGVRSVGTFLRRARKKIKTFRDRINDADPPANQ